MRRHSVTCDRIRKPLNQNSYIESFNGLFRHECLNERLTSLYHAKAAIEAWRRENNEERAKKGFGGLTPSAYAKKLTIKVVIVSSDAKSNCYVRAGNVK
ncbi:transposase [Halomonas sp. FME1]|uniref:Transposase n=1 Tax=Halomonas casei TaxID=2742613 RepID=A0ABR9F7E0_9GAMM|nr:transposase [Halomonas casei]